MTRLAAGGREAITSGVVSIPPNNGETQESQPGEGVTRFGPHGSDVSSRIDTY